MTNVLFEVSNNLLLLLTTLISALLLNDRIIHGFKFKALFSKNNGGKASF